MAEIVSILAVFIMAYIVNVIFKKLGFEPESNPYFGDYEE